MTEREIKNQDSMWARFGAIARRFASDCSGATAVEYILMGALLGAVVIAGISVVTTPLSEIYAIAVRALGS